MQCLQYPSQINVDNLISIKHETRRHFISKGQEYLKDKINELATNSESKNIRDLCRGIHEFEMPDLLAYFQFIMSGWKNHSVGC